MSDEQRDLLAEGVRRFAARRFFDAHEAWEDAWREADGPVRELFQGLVQVAAACHHLQAGRRRQAMTLLGRARGHLAEARRVRAGVDVEALLRSMEVLEAHVVRGTAVDNVAWPRLKLPPGHVPAGGTAFGGGPSTS